MLIARISHRGEVHYGIPDEFGFHLLEGSIFKRIARTGKHIKMEEASLLCPVVPRLIIGLGRNYHSHNKEMNLASPERPAVFFKPGGSLIAHLDPIIMPTWATRVDYEGELGVVIGRKMKNVRENEAADFIFGCTCFNDITERDVGSSGLINQDISKCCDTFGPCGPWIRTDIAPDETTIKTIHNGKIVQQDSTGNTVFSTARVLSELSFFMTLMPGDLVITGTPGGIGPLLPGDTIEVEIDGIGRLSNPVQIENQ